MNLDELKVVRNKVRAAANAVYTTVDDAYAIAADVYIAAAADAKKATAADVYAAAIATATDAYIFAVDAEKVNISANKTTTGESKK